MSENWDKLRQQAEEAQSQKELTQAEKLWRETLKETDNFDRVDRRIALTYEGLAECLWHQGKFKEATDCCQKLLTIYEQIFGEDQFDVGVVANNLAMLNHVQENYEEAEAYYQRALRIKSKHLGEKHPDIIKLLGNYSNLLLALNKKSEADALRSGSTMITAKNWSKSTVKPEFVEGSVSSIGLIVYKPKSQLEKSTHFQPAIPPEETLRAVRHWELLRKIAEKKSEERSFPEAEAIWTATLAYFEPHADQDPRRMAYTLDSLGDVHCFQDKNELAEPFYKRAIEIKSKNLGPEHVVVVRGMNTLARLYYQLNRFKEAEPLAKKCVDAYEKLLGAEHPEYASALHNLGTLYHIQLRFKDAEPLYRKALIIRQKTLGPDHPETKGLARSLANLLRSTGRAEEASRIHGADAAVITGTWRALSIPEADQLMSVD